MQLTYRMLASTGFHTAAFPQIISPKQGGIDPTQYYYITIVISPDGSIGWTKSSWWSTCSLITGGARLFVIVYFCIHTPRCDPLGSLDVQPTRLWHGATQPVVISSDCRKDCSAFILVSGADFPSVISNVRVFDCRADFQSSSSR